MFLCFHVLISTQNDVMVNVFLSCVQTSGEAVRRSVGDIGGS